MTNHSCPVLSHVMKHGPIITTLKQSGKSSLDALPITAAKMIHQAKSNGKVMLIFSLTNMELFIHVVPSTSQGQK